MDIPQEILDLAVRRALDGSKGKLVVCPFLRRKGDNRYFCL